MFFKVNILFFFFLPKCLGYICCSPRQRRGRSCVSQNQNRFPNITWCQEKMPVTSGFPVQSLNVNAKCCPFAIVYSTCKEQTSYHFDLTKLKSCGWMGVRKTLKTAVLLISLSLVLIFCSSEFLSNSCVLWRGVGVFRAPL